MNDNFSDTIKQLISALVSQAQRTAIATQDQHWRAVLRNALQANDESELRRILSALIEEDD